MSRVKLFYIFIFVFSFNFALAAPAYKERGKRTEKNYKAYVDRLKKAHKKFFKVLKKEDPKLWKKLKTDAPEEVKHGYQVLPKIIENEPSTYADKRATSTSYSWKRTDDMIRDEISEIEEFEEKLGIISKLKTKKDKLAILKKMGEEYPQFNKDQKTIDAHVKYNQFWQKAIFESPDFYKKITVLHDAVLERQLIQDRLTTGDLKGKDPNILRKRDKELADLIYKDVHSNADTPKFLKVLINDKRKTILKVKVYTDITDDKYIETIKTAIENNWQTKTKSKDQKIRVVFQKISTKDLYKNKKAPKPGDKIDVYKHSELFPRDGGIFTTGAESTYAIPGRYVALGPQPISKKTVAHEFGHILGFQDSYFRGFRDRGVEGFEVLEIVPNPKDIMCAPGHGSVNPHHFTRILKGRSSSQ